MGGGGRARARLLGVGALPRAALLLGHEADALELLALLRGAAGERGRWAGGGAGAGRECMSDGREGRHRPGAPGTAAASRRRRVGAGRGRGARLAGLPVRADAVALPDAPPLPERRVEARSAAAHRRHARPIPPPAGQSRGRRSSGGAGGPGGARGRIGGERPRRGPRASYSSAAYFSSSVSTSLGSWSASTACTGAPGAREARRA